MSSDKNRVTLDEIVALCKRRGFVYQTAELYGGLNGVYDFGPLGCLMINNIKSFWITWMHRTSDDIVQLDGALLGPESVWKASGHVENFHDPMVDCLACKHRYRADDINLEKPCPHCGNKQWTDVRQFNMMFKTELGATAGATSHAYLRPETAQTVFVDFKNVMSTTRVKIPFGIAQIGKAFRNEITPKQFLFRVREFEQMELEWFCKGSTAASFFDFWTKNRMDFYTALGINKDHIHMRSHEKAELSHYSSQTSDVEYEFPFGWKELEGIANRGDFDLTQHSKHSGKEVQVFDDETKESYTPHVVESSVGVGRLFLALLFDAYRIEETDEEPRVVLALHPYIAPIKAAFLPLTKKQSDAMHKIYKDIKENYPFMVQFDESASIGKRYRRQDEIGTPLCFTFDFESEVDNKVTVRHRDSMKQERIAISDIGSYLTRTISFKKQGA